MNNIMLSVIIPFYNEEENLPILYDELTRELAMHKNPYEVIFVNDGSSDKSAEVIGSITKKDSHIKLVSYHTRLGKGNALQKGVNESKGDVIVFMDADLQDDPADLTAFLKKLDEGYDLINGVRRRKDNLVIRTYSKLGNAFLRNFVRSPLTDINCGFKMMKRDILSEIPFYSNNFRFLPIAAHRRGYRVAEIPVNNRPRKFGVSKFGMGKIVIGFIDTITAYFLYEFAERPLHFFGVIGGIFFGLGALVTLYMTYERIFYGVLLYRRPALQFAILFIVVGIQIIMTGFIGELIVYINKKKK